MTLLTARLVVRISHEIKVLGTDQHFPRTQQYIFSPGLDLFRLTDKFNLIPILDGSFDSEMTCLTVSQSMLS